MCISRSAEKKNGNITLFLFYCKKFPISRAPLLAVIFAIDFFFQILTIITSHAISAANSRIVISYVSHFIGSWISPILENRPLHQSAIIAATVEQLLSDRISMYLTNYFSVKNDAESGILVSYENVMKHLKKYSSFV